MSIQIPTYIANPEGDQQYNQLLNQALRGLLNVNGWQPCSLTAAQVTALTASFPVPSMWFNTDLAKLQICTAAGIVETVTSA